MTTENKPTAQQVSNGEELADKEQTPRELERKFLISEMPKDLESYPHKEVTQGYLAIMDNGTEVRLRQDGDEYFETIKSGDGKDRSEHQAELTKEQYDAIWQATEGRRVNKTRYKIPHDDSIIELDIYRGELEGLVVAEVEFTTPDEMENFIPLSWFGEEKSDDKRYKNQSLAIYGLPTDNMETIVTKSEMVESASEVLGIPEYDLDEGVEKLASMIKEKLSTQTTPIIVEIAGGSASGKTSAVARKIKEMFSDEATIFSMDDYYRGKTFMNSEAERGNELNWDQPEALNMELINEHLQGLKRGEAIQKPIYDFQTSEASGVEEVAPNKIIIVEGLFALNDEIADNGDIRAFVDIGTHGRILRRLLRDVIRTGQRPADILKYFADVVEPMHERYVQSTKRNASIVVKNEYRPNVEAERSGLHEIQVKFAGDVDETMLRNAGADRLNVTTQVDYYYNPKDRNLIDTDEILRIRDENGHKVLTYKGPKTESEYRVRPKFEFEIDDETEKSFLSIYGEQVKFIRKERVMYQLDGLIFSVDKVSSEEDGQITDLGKFLEIRSTDDMSDPNRFDGVINKLGLDKSQAIKQSYFEM